MLTAARRNEAGGMTAGEIEAGLWTVPAERSKIKTAIERPLPSAALGLVEPCLAGKGGHLFGKGRRAGFSGWSRAKARLDNRLAETELGEWTLHDLRRSVATALANANLAPPHIVEALLGHRHENVGSVHGVYNRATYREQVGEALAMWASVLMGEINGTRKVVPLQQKLE